MSIFGTPCHTSPEKQGPAGFHWLIPGLLGGMPRPGLADMNGDMQALGRVQVKLLVTLTAEWEPDAELFRRNSINSLYAPIPDFGTPTLAQAMEICAQVEAYTRRGDAVVFHCKAGKGRTGTMLAAMLVWSGTKAGAAIANTRARNPAWIETDGQEAFLNEFSAHLARNGR